VRSDIRQARPTCNPAASFFQAQSFSQAHANDLTSKRNITNTTAVATTTFHEDSSPRHCHSSLSLSTLLDNKIATMFGGCKFSHQDPTFMNLIPASRSSGTNPIQAMKHSRKKHAPIQGNIRLTIFSPSLFYPTQSLPHSSPKRRSLPSRPRPTRLSTVSSRPRLYYTSVRFLLQPTKLTQPRPPTDPHGRDRLELTYFPPIVRCE